MDNKKQSEILAFLDDFNRDLKQDLDLSRMQDFVEFAKKNAETHQEEIAQIAQLLVDRGHHKHGICALEFVVSFGCSADIWERFIKIVFSSGLIQKANSYADEYLCYLYQKKRFSRGLSFIGDCKALGIDRKLIDIFEFFFFLQQGNIKALEEFISRLIEKRQSYRDEFFFLVLQDLCHNYSSWKESFQITKYFIDNIKDFIGGKNNYQIDEKLRVVFLKVLYRYIIFGNKIDNSLAIAIGNYALSFSNKELGILSMKYVDNEKVRDVFFEKLYVLDDSSPEEEDEQGYDLAEDLFVDENKDITEQEKIEKNAQFFLEIDIKKAEKFIHQLEDINSDHPLIKQYYDSLEKETQREEIQTIKGGIADIKQCLLREIQVYTKGQRKEEEEFIGLSQEFMDKFTNAKNNSYRDIVCHLYYMKNFNQAIEFLKKIKEENEDSDNIVEIYYLLISMYMEARNYSCALELIDESIASLPLEKDQAVCFYYLKGECYYQMREEKNAIDIFKNLKYYKNSYRLTNQRLSSLEQSK